jgi:hypothetical protein
MSTEASAAYTTDLRIFVGLDESIASLVAWLTTSLAAGEPWPPVREALTRRFALSFDDARTCVDRLQGGVVRANTEDEGNQPDLTLDPVAWHSYQLARGGTFPTPPRGSAAWHGLIELLGHDLPGALAASSAFADAADPDEQRATQVWRGVLTGQPVARSALGAMATWRLHGLLEATLGANPTLPLQQRGDLAVALAMALSAEADELLEVAPTPGTAAWAGAASLHEVARRLEQVFDELGAPALAPGRRPTCAGSWRSACCAPARCATSTRSWRPRAATRPRGSARPRSGSPTTSSTTSARCSTRSRAATANSTTSRA